MSMGLIVDATQDTIPGREDVMTVEAKVLGTGFADGIELVENEPFSMREGTELLLHLSDNRKVSGRVLRADDAVRALVEIDQTRWWLERKAGSHGSRWVVRTRQGA